MRRALLIALGGAGILIAGCGGGDEDSPATTSNAGAGQGGTLEWALPERPAELDPLLAETDSERLVSRQIHEPLVERLRRPFAASPGLPGLAASVRPSSDFRVWELRLRPGVRFQDGTPLNAQAVLANVERWQTTTSSGLPPQPALFADTPKPGLVRFILERPDRNLDQRLAAPQLGIVSPATLARIDAPGAGAFTASGSGTGPFELRERSGEGLLLARNAAWWGARRALGPAVDQIQFTVLPAASDRAGALTEGGMEVATGLGRTEANEVTADPLLTVEPQGGGSFIGLERSVRGIPAGDPFPSLNSVWLTRLATG